MGQSALKRRDALGQISHRHGNVHVGTMRRMYGHSFAAGLAAETSLDEVLELSGPNRAQSTMSDFVTLQPVEHHNEGFFHV
jgi:hypothetical protein